MVFMPSWSRSALRAGSPLDRNRMRDRQREAQERAAARRRLCRDSAVGLGHLAHDGQAETGPGQLRAAGER